MFDKFLLLNYFFLMIFIMMSIAFITLYERKILGYIHNRKSVNKISIMGIFQPFSDGIKLLSKESFLLEKSNMLFYMISPIMNFFLIFLMYMLLPFYNLMDWFNLGILFFLALLGLNVLSVILIGWSSNSSYSFLSSMRMVAQIISYEISLMFLLLSMLICLNSFSLMQLEKLQVYIWLIFYYMLIGIIIIMIFLIESNRVPFDFIEGESELVSGYNIEYGSGYFVMIFIAEYLSILFMCFLMVLMFFYSNLMSMMFYMKLMVMIYLYMLIRGSFPRFRYDMLMIMAWKIFLPLSLEMYCFYYSFIILLL